MSLIEKEPKIEDNLIKDFVKEDFSGVDPEDLKKEEERKEGKKERKHGYPLKKKEPSHEEYLEWLKKVDNKNQ